MNTASVQFKWLRAIQARIAAENLRTKRGRRLTPVDLTIAVSATRFIGDDLTFFRAQRDLAADCGVNLSTVNTSLKRLVAAGFLRAVEAIDKTRGKFHGRPAGTFKIAVPEDAKEGHDDRDEAADAADLCMGGDKQSTADLCMGGRKQKGDLCSGGDKQSRVSEKGLCSAGDKHLCSAGDKHNTMEHSIEGDDLTLDGLGQSPIMEEEVSPLSPQSEKSVATDEGLSCILNLLAMLFMGRRTNEWDVHRQSGKADRVMRRPRLRSSV